MQLTLVATADMGFLVRSDDGPGTIEHVSVAANGRTLVLHLAEAPGGNAEVRAGFDHLGTGLNISAGASTNLRDSHVDSWAETPGWNICPHFALPVAQAE